MPDMPTTLGADPATPGPSKMSMSAGRPSLWTAIIVGSAVAYLAFARASFSRLG